jgi:hypothetical protein
MWHEGQVQKLVLLSKMLEIEQGQNYNLFVV